MEEEHKYGLYLDLYQNTYLIATSTHIAAIHGLMEETKEELDSSTLLMAFIQEMGSPNVELYVDEVDNQSNAIALHKD